jgi:hypothetical protein
LLLILVRKEEECEASKKIKKIIKMALWAPARAWACRANRCPWAGEFSTQGQGQRLERGKKESTHKKFWAMGTYGRAGRPDNHGSNTPDPQ